MWYKYNKQYYIFRIAFCTKSYAHYQKKIQQHSKTIIIYKKHNCFTILKSVIFFVGAEGVEPPTLCL